MILMPSSRATIAAGTRPPRVTQTTAWNGPAPASRQASARASRWNWSHDTGNAFCGWVSGCCSGCAMNFLGRTHLAHIEHEIEARGEAVAGLGHAHHELAAEEAVAAVHRLVREIELSGEHRPFRRLHLDVVVAGAAGVERRQDRAEPVAALGVGEQVPAIAKARGVVFAALVRVPEIDERPFDRPARAREHEPADLDEPRAGVRLEEVGALRRARLEIGALALAHRRLVAVVALRCRRRALRDRQIRTGEPGARGGERMAQNLAA